MTPDSLDLAITRWSVECASRQAFAGGYTALLGVWLAGWFCRVYSLAPATGATGPYAATFRRAWHDADGFVRVNARRSAHAYVSDGCEDPVCVVCGLVEHQSCHRGRQ